MIKFKKIVKYGGKVGGCIGTVTYNVKYGESNKYGQHRPKSIDTVYSLNYNY